MSFDCSRTQQLIGKSAMNRLKHSAVTIFGVGGVGSFTVEALARCSIGKLILIDSDTVSESNINRQIMALNSTVGQYKTEAMKKRISDINPKAEVEIHNCFYLPGQDDDSFFESDYIVDALDTMSAKLEIIDKANKKDVRVISATSAGNKLNPLMFEVSDIFNTSVCPICRVLRRELRKRRIHSLKVVYSKEPPVISHTAQNSENIPGSISFVPSVMGLIIASEVVKDLIENCR